MGVVGAAFVRASIMGAGFSRIRFLSACVLSGTNPERLPQGGEWRTGLKISGLNELRERLERLRPEEVMAPALAEQAERIATRVREGLSEQPGGAGHDEPWLRSGALRGSVGVQAEGLQAAVGSSDPAAVPQELGTARMPARPFLMPVAAAMGEEVARAVGAAVMAALRGDSPDAGSTRVDLCGDGPDGSDLPSGGAIAGGGVPTSTSHASATVAGDVRPAANGALPDHPTPNLFAGPGVPTDNYVIDVADGDEIARDFISRNCRGMILREFPGQCLDMTIDEIIGLKNTSDAAGREAWKLLNDNRFRK